MPDADPELLAFGSGYYTPEASTPEQARVEILDQWNSPANRAMASIGTGQLDIDHLALIVSEKVAEIRFGQAWQEGDMDEHHPANRRLELAKAARDAYEAQSSRS